MSGKRAKRERRELRASGQEDKITERRRLQREAEDKRAEMEAAARAEREAETDEQRQERMEAARRSERRIRGLMSAFAAVAGAGISPPVLAPGRRPSYHRRRG